MRNILIGAAAVVAYDIYQRSRGKAGLSAQLRNMWEGGTRKAGYFRRTNKHRRRER